VELRITVAIIRADGQIVVRRPISYGMALQYYCVKVSFCLWIYTNWLDYCFGHCTSS